MLRMFYDARAFDQNLCDWKFPTIITNMFVSTSCDIQNNPTESAACQSCLESGRRRLGISNSINNNNNNNNKNNNRSNNRSLQESGGDTVAPFVTTIKFYTTVNEDSAAAPPLTILVVVVIGFISSLMLFFVIA